MPTKSPVRPASRRSNGASARGTRSSATQVDRQQLNELLYQALETEIGGVQVYTRAISCAVNSELREEWQKYLEETREHERILKGVFAKLGLNTNAESPGRSVVRKSAESLVQMMQMAKQAGKPQAAQLVAAECVVLAETKDHQNWELIGEVAKKLTGAEASALKEAHGEVEDQEDEHLYHTMGWSRELWLESLGLPAVLPPPEEKKKVKTAIGAARAKQSRKELIPASMRRKK
jgi:rubrerythrin